MITKQTDMEDHTIELNEHTWLEVEYEMPAGESGSYDTPPSDPFISIQKITLCQDHPSKETQEIEIFGDDGLDDTLFPIDMGMIEFDIEESLR